MSEHEDETPTPDETPDETPAPDEPGVSDDEAAEAEEAEQDDEPDTDDESAPADEPTPQGLSDVEREKRFVKAEKAAAAYARRISDIYEEAVTDLLECPLCPSVHKGFVNVNDAGRVPPDVMNAVTMFLGYAVPRDYPPSSQHSACPECQGEGKVQTGSKVPGKDTITCPRCNGNGYLGPQGERSNGAVTQEGVITGPTAVPTGAGVPDIDPTGEPRLLPNGAENPNYGKWPQYKVPIEPWGTTANLTVQDAVS